MNKQDVLIIGAGAAGTSAAFHLAKLGHKVTVIEKRLLEEIKPCGGGMAASVQNWFPFDLLPAVDEVINRVGFTWCFEDEVIAELPGSKTFWIVRREHFDRYLSLQATSAGAKFLRGVCVIDLQKLNDFWEVTCSNGTKLEAHTVVIADGSNSPWPTRLGIGPKKQSYASTTSVRLEGRGNLESGFAKFEFGLVHHGFAWAFPINNGITVGAGTFIGSQKLESKQILTKFLPILGFNPEDGIRQQSKLRIWNGQHNLHGNGIVIAGDAASLCDPFLAEGIRPAIMSGCEAAKTIDKFLKGEALDLSEYTTTMQRQWGTSMAWGRRIAQVFYRFPKVGYQLGIKRPTAPQRIAQILSGELGYADIAQRVIQRLLLQR